MPDDETLKCPLCHGEGGVTRSALIALLTDRSLPEQAEKYLAELLNAQHEFSAVNANALDFQKEVHSWNPQLPIWRRSPKE